MSPTPDNSTSWLPPFLRALRKAAGGFLRRFSISPRNLRLSRLEVAVPALPQAWEGVRIAHLSDLHAGRLVSLDYLRTVVAAANSASPDLVAFTGDLASRQTDLASPLAEVLAALRAPEGKFAVLGNHDYPKGPAAVGKVLAQAGFRLLRNEKAILSRGGENLCLAGLEDLWHHPMPLRRLLEGVPEPEPRILLIHNPDYAETMPRQPRIDLLLCGHTHGGQILFPPLPPLLLPTRHRRYVGGLFKGPACPVYVSRGVGVVGLPFRVNCPPEIAILTLRRSRAAATSA